MIVLRTSDLQRLFDHARAASPNECCGLIGGNDDNRAQSIYHLRNVASQPLVAYEAAPEDLFEAQRSMRDRGEKLLAIYHSHPRSADPLPSDTDVRLAFYPAAVYLIIGLGDGPVMHAFRLSEKEHSWEAVEYQIVDE